MRAIAGANRGVPFALMHLDLDRFKAVNDTLGHGAGDQVIARVASVIRSEMRIGDMVARIGGDEFVIILSGEHLPDSILRLGARIIQQVEQPIPCSTGVARISVSIGVCLSRQPESRDAEAMIAVADAALYESKRDGRGRCMISTAG